MFIFILMALAASYFDTEAEEFYEQAGDFLQSNDLWKKTMHYFNEDEDAKVETIQNLIAQWQEIYEVAETLRMLPENLHGHIEPNTLIFHFRLHEKLDFACMIYFILKKDLEKKNLKNQQPEDPQQSDDSDEENEVPKKKLKLLRWFKK